MGIAERTHINPVFRFAAALVPLLCGLGAVVMANIPISFVGGLEPAPLLGLVPVYFWCLVRPDLMTPAAALGVGMMEDVMSGAPPGTWTLAFVVAYAVVSRQRDSFSGLSGVAAVLGFAAAALAACSCAYLTVAALYGHLPPLGPVVAELAMTVVCYIPGTLVAGAVHRRLVGPLRSDL
jgi:rod shape-determining protein MreD